jgi:hypothetical protein
LQDNRQSRQQVTAIRKTQGMSYADAATPLYASPAARHTIATPRRANVAGLSHHWRHIMATSNQDDKDTQGGKQGGQGNQGKQGGKSQQSDTGGRSKSGSTGGTQGGTPEQHAEAGRQSHKNDR